MVGERLNRNLAGLWSIKRPSHLTFSEDKFKRYLTEAVRLCEEAERYNVRFGNHRWSKECLSLIGNDSLRWGAEVQIYVPSARRSKEYGVKLYQRSAGGEESKDIVGGIYQNNSDGRREMLEAVGNWQNRPGMSFTLEECFASMDLLLAAGKYWNLERGDALPLSPDLTERTKSFWQWLIEKYPLFYANEGINLYSGVVAMFDSKNAQYSGWEVCMENLNTHRGLEVLLVSENPTVKCFQVSYPPLEQLGYGIPTTRPSGPEKREKISELSDLAEYVEWLVE